MSDETKIKLGLGFVTTLVGGFITNAIICTVFIVRIDAKADAVNVKVDSVVSRLEKIEVAIGSVTKDVQDLKIRVSIMEHQRASYRTSEEGESAAHQPWKARQ